MMNAKDIPSGINWTAVGTLTMLMIQVGVGIWYASSLSARVNTLEERMAAMQNSWRSGEVERRTDRDLLITVNVSLANIEKQLNKMEQKLEDRK